MKAPRVVVTGAGAVTPFGVGVEATMEGVFGGASAIGPITRFDASGFPTTFGAEAPEVDPKDYLPEAHRRWRKLVDRKAAWALAAASEAMEQAKLGAGAGQPEAFGVSVGAEAGRPDLARVATEFMRFREAPDPTLVYESVDPLEMIRNAPNGLSALLSSVHDARGPCLTISTACTSSAQAIGEALLRIRRGEAEVMLAGGADCLVEAFMLTGFSLLGALSKRNDDPAHASRPFDRDRDGFVLGEGAGFLVLEGAERALARGVEPLAEIAGYGASLNAYRITDSPPDGGGAYESMVEALHSGSVQPEDVAYVNAHGTSTQMNDVSESRAIRRVFGAHPPPVSSTKSGMGHLVAACGAVEALVCVAAVRQGRIPPTACTENVDPECGVDPVPGVARSQDVPVAISNSFGFGGSNGTLVIKRWEP